MSLDIARLRDLASAATPGPWRWGGNGNPEVRELYLSTVHHGRRFVMQFTGWPGLGGHGGGHSPGQPRFRSDPGDGGHMVDASGLLRYEVLDNQTINAAGNLPYRWDVSGIDNPDADYIAAANPDTILALLTERDHIANYVGYAIGIIELEGRGKHWGQGHYANRALAYLHDLARRLDPDAGAESQPDPGLVAQESEWDDPYMGVGRKRCGVRCESTHEGRRCMRPAGHTPAHRFTVAVSGESVTWHDADTVEPPAGWPPELDLRAEARPGDPPAGWKAENAKADGDDSTLRQTLWDALHAGEVDGPVAQAILDRWDATTPGALRQTEDVDLDALRKDCGYYEDPDDADYADDDRGTDGLIDYKNALEDLVGRLTTASAPDTDRQPVGPIARAKAYEGATVLVNLTLNDAYRLVRHGEARYTGGLVVRISESPPFGLQDDDAVGSDGP